MNAEDIASTSGKINDLRLHDKDVGSSQVQIARLTARIMHLTGHLANHKKDNHTRRGLMAMISRRRRLTAYLKRNAPDVHSKTLAALGLRK
ncbi:30S ribosomal protein S15 [Candidatus Persebacteraceae bacterium Df01]|jgi:small subunit ribosomal protein S15|uniref:Small ribosomal subunit protein uS15 n=1 Tax=Candidatus Doriopsillibacter californiensis TaxID=2970740 RepID=A0ABT7QMF6_9GAMM|nr:30S ribosomal protein S15 [Candidatus Persebacteraceae bacterium Df01]